MQPAAVAALLGLGFSLIGSVLLAVRLNSLLTELSITAQAHDVSIQQLADPHSDVAIFTGLERHIERGEVSARHRTIVGIVMVGVGGVLQAMAILLTV